MVRSILSVVVGYVVLAVAVSLSSALVLLTPGFVFQAHTVEPSLLFTVFNLFLSLLAALAGGYVAALVAGENRPTPVKVLAGSILIVGLALAVPQQLHSHPAPTAEELDRMTLLERASHAREPVWYSFLIPFVGCFGVLAGGMLRTRTRG